LTNLENGEIVVNSWYRYGNKTGQVCWNQIIHKMWVMKKQIKSIQEMKQPILDVQKWNTSQSLYYVKSAISDIILLIRKGEHAEYVGQAIVLRC
jgi:hypothetical protein